jgi:hypothetical protein
MSAKFSLFSKIRAAGLALGQSERTASRKARLLSSASRTEFVRLTPKQNVKLGLSPKARHYALRGTKRVTKATPTISARQFETKRASELFGLTPERATKARRHGAVSYVSADQRERVAKASITREENKVVAAIKKLRSSGEAVPSNSPDKGGTERHILFLNTPRAVTAPSGVASSRASIFLTANGSGSSTTRAA